MRSAGGRSVAEPTVHRVVRRPLASLWSFATVPPTSASDVTAVVKNVRTAHVGRLKSGVI